MGLENERKQCDNAATFSLNFTKHRSLLERRGNQKPWPFTSLRQTSNWNISPYPSYPCPINQIIGQRNKSLQYFLHLSDFADTGLNARLVAKQFIFILFFKITP